MKYRICIIGCGNISNTRHIPAVKKLGNAVITGLISDQSMKIERTLKQHKYLSGINTFVINSDDNVKTQLDGQEWFLNDVDAVIIGTPPKQHYMMALSSLSLGKHVLVEKPMMMSAGQCDEVIRLADDNGLILNVMHSFQFSNGMMRLKKIFDSGEMGDLKSILEIQLSNRDRRLPVWYNDLPFGLFYDEAAHFFYSARKFGGRLKVLNANAVFNENDNTPRFLEAQLYSGNIPVQMYMNFNSPICEWGMLLICDKKIAIYDYFKDILIILDNDRRHLAKDVLRNSISFSGQFWRGFLINGMKMVSGKLLYGHDVCIRKFVESIGSRKPCEELSALSGREVVVAMNEVVDRAKGV